MLRELGIKLQAWWYRRISRKELEDAAQDLSEKVNIVTSKLNLSRNSELESELEAILDEILDFLADSDRWDNLSPESKEILVQSSEKAIAILRGQEDSIYTNK